MKRCLHPLSLSLLLGLVMGCDPPSDDTGEAVTAESCREKPACVLYGACGVGPSGQCGPTEEAHCRASEIACLDEGRCTFTGGHCLPSSDEDCRASTNCPVEGHCTDFGDVCGAVSSSDCLDSDMCKAFKRCFPHLGNCEYQIKSHH